MAKFQDIDREVMRPAEIKEKFKHYGLDKSHIALYSMICWITEANLYSGTETMTFEEFVQYAGYFFSQRHLDEGLKYMFMLFDTDQKGYVLKNEFDFQCA